MSWFVCDVEADGPCPGPWSMVCFGIVRVDRDMATAFYGQTRPISERWEPEALAVSGFSREDHAKFSDPAVVMEDACSWVVQNSKGRPVFVSDNVAFDWQWINHYFHVYCGSNPFGFSARRIGDLYTGMQKDVFAKWKHLRRTRHDHNPVNDARGNVEALLKMRDMGLKIPMP